MLDEPSSSAKTWASVNQSRSTSESSQKNTQTNTGYKIVLIIINSDWLLQ